VGCFFCQECIATTLADAAVRQPEVELLRFTLDWQTYNEALVVGPPTSYVYTAKRERVVRDWLAAQLEHVLEEELDDHDFMSDDDDDDGVVDEVEEFGHLDPEGHDDDAPAPVGPDADDEQIVVAAVLAPRLAAAVAVVRIDPAERLALEAPLAAVWGSAKARLREIHERVAGENAASPVEPRDDQIMLVVADFAHGTACCFASWCGARASFHDRMGRRVRVGNRNRVVWNVANNAPIEDFGGLHVVAHDVGVAFKQVPKHLRPTMPEWALVLKEHESFKLYSGPYETEVDFRSADFVTDGNAACCLCDRRLSLAMACDSSHYYYGCKVCSLRWHQHCCEAWAVDHANACDFEDFVCPLCIEDAAAM
jgi:hypothetical protein